MLQQEVDIGLVTGDAVRVATQSPVHLRPDQPDPTVPDTAGVGR